MFKLRMLNIFRVYFSLSREGKKFLKELKGKLTKEDVHLFKQTMSKPQKRGRLLKSLSRCDKMFTKYIADFPKAVGNQERYNLYKRFVPFSWGMLEVRCRVFDAFNVVYDKEAENRCVLLAFFHREWNDLIDQHGYSFEDLSPVVETQEEIPGKLCLLRRLRQVLDVLTPRNRFKKYYQHVSNYMALPNLRRMEKNAKEYVEEASFYSSLTQTYLMVEDIDDNLMEFLKLFSAWYYLLDELSDLDKDRKAGRVTYMSLAKDPFSEIKKRYKDCEEASRRLATHPELILGLMKVMTEKVIAARRQGFDLDRYCFGN